MNHRWTRPVAILATFALVSATQEPQDPPPPVVVPYSCQGCLADVDFDLPDAVYTIDVIDGGVMSVSVDWTITRHIEFHGLCGDLEGSCLVVRHCTALGSATGTITDQFGQSETYHVSAGVNQCGATHEASVDLGNWWNGWAGGQATAEITAHCPACAVQ